MEARSIITRAEARAHSLPEYFTGKPCNLGGISLRTTGDKRCHCDAHKAMRAANAQERYLRDRDARLAKQRRYAAENAELVRASSRKHYEANKAAYVKRAAEWAQANQERVREIARNWAKNNPAKTAPRVRARQAAKLNAIPPWFDELDALVIAEAYDLAKKREAATGFKWHVDHIIPLRGKNVCGLHVGANIQVIPAVMNLQKSNKHAIVL